MTPYGKKKDKAITYIKMKITKNFGNLGMRIFSEEPSDSNDVPYCPPHSCKKLGRSLGEKTKK